MATTTDHYKQLLAPIYTWMVGGTQAALELGAADLADLAGTPPKDALAIDLGAGFGMHTVPLARAGWQVLAVDSSAELLAELNTLAQGLPVTTHCGDLLRFTDHLSPGQQAGLVLCMGDTLTHLESMDAVAELGRQVSTALAPGGRFIATFRDYSRLPTGPARFIPVRADVQRILTCFLEEFDQHVQVHDLLHERIDGQWKTQVSSYRKLRLAPEKAKAFFEAAGLRCQVTAGPRGMLRLEATA